MLVTVSVALLFGAVTAVLIWARRVGLMAALGVWLSGFTAAATGIAGPVHALLNSVISSIH